MEMMMGQTLVRACYFLMTLLCVAAPARAQDAGSPGVTRDVLGSGLPAAAPGQELGLRRVTFAPGASIPGEVHSGAQVILVVSGTLGLQVMGGEVVVRRANPDGTVGEPQTIKAGPDQLQLKPGDTALEGETLVLHPYNPGQEPVVILVASLLQAGKPQSVPITQSIVVPAPAK